MKLLTQKISRAGKIVQDRLLRTLIVVQHFLKDIKARLTDYVSVLPSNRNQSTDLLCKAIYWFLYEGNTGT